MLSFDRNEVFDIVPVVMDIQRFVYDFLRCQFMVAIVTSDDPVTNIDGVVSGPFIDLL